MQPYFMPYIGYFQLINSVDKFVLYDNIKYTKKGWINRNRILVNGKDEFISIPLKKGSDFLHVNERFLSDSSDNDLDKLLNKISENYRKAPNFKKVISLVQEIFTSRELNLFEFIKNSLQATLKYLEIETPVINSSTLPIDHNLRAEAKIIEICKYLHADIYINPIGGLALYSNSTFNDNNIELYFIESIPFEYNQYGNEFIPWLSIIDIMMFNESIIIKQMLETSYKLIKNERL